MKYTSPFSQPHALLFYSLFIFGAQGHISNYYAFCSQNRSTRNMFSLANVLPSFCPCRQQHVFKGKQRQPGNMLSFARIRAVYSSHYNSTFWIWISWFLKGQELMFGGLFSLFLCFSFFFCLWVLASDPAGLCRPESWPPARTRARPLWFFIR